MLSCEVEASNPQLDSVTLLYPNQTTIDITQFHTTPIKVRDPGIYICMANNSDTSATLTYNIMPVAGKLCKLFFL